MHHPGGKCSDLAIQVVLDSHGFGHARDSLSRFGWAQVVHRSEKKKILAAAQAAVKTFISSGMVAKLAARFRGVALDVKTAKSGVPVCGNDQGGEDAE
jgi:hypothetical protein